MTEQNQNVKSAQRTLELLEAVSRFPHGISFVDLVAELPYPKSSLHGLLQTIVAMKWLTFDPRDRLYSIGVRPWEVGQVFRPSRDLTIHSRRYLREANEALDETIQLGILDDLDVVYIDKVEGKQPLRLVSNVGSRLPAYATGIGKALLSGLSDEVLSERYAGMNLPGYTNATITSGNELIRVIGMVRGQGYATDDGEYSNGVFCVAVPVRSPSGEVVTALSCSVPKARLESGDIRVPRIIEVLTSCALQITSALNSPSGAIA